MTYSALSFIVEIHRRRRHTHTLTHTDTHIYIWLICQPFASLYFPFYFTQKKAATKNEPTMVVQMDRLCIHSD